MIAQEICKSLCPEDRSNIRCQHTCLNSAFNCCFECIYRYDHRMPCGLKMYESKKDKYFKYLLLRAKLKKEGYIFNEK